ncbi:MAG: PQQ-binding-like beta-propeller repeat protein [Lentisphaerales bacterium]|nr:PQQ-binding-like beta-propeller repeat protein [Lentisphaerales bacterium]
MPMYKSIIFLCLSLCTISLAETSWAQFLGPDRSGQVTDKKFIPWNQPLKEQWSLPLGEGFGGAIIDKAEVFILDRQEDELDLIKCFDLESGKTKWTCKYKSEGRFGFNGTRSVPAVDNEAVYTIGCMGNILCVNRRTGKKLWERNLLKDWSAPSPPWGFGSSPLLYKDFCIVAPLGEVGLAALNKKTGETVWESEAIGSNPGYSSPIIHNLLNEKMLLQMAGDQLTAVNPDNGKNIFNWSGYSVKRAIPAPIKISDNKVFITGGYQQGSVMLTLKKQSDKVSIKEDFRIKEIGSQIHAPILKNDYLYGNFNENDNLKKRSQKQGLTCFDLNGKMLWKTGEKPNLDRGSVIMINNHLLALDGKTGELILIEAQPESYKEIFRQKVFGQNGDKIWAPMAYYQGHLVLRDLRSLKCLKVY